MPSYDYVVRVTCNDADVTQEDVAAMAAAYMDMLIDAAYVDSQATGVYVDIDTVPAEDGAAC